MTSSPLAPIAPASPAGLADGALVLLRDGRDAYPAMLAAIASAREEIVLEMYWFGSDAVGRRFSEALAARAAAGVAVRVVYDAIGSAPHDPALFADLRARGGDVRAFRPLVGIWRPASLERVFTRDHRKLLVCDGKVGFTGGINIGMPWAPVEEGGEGFRDDMVRVEGHAARELRAVFYDTWRRVLARKERRDPARLPRDVPRLSPEPPRDVWVLGSRRRPRRRAIRATYIEWINEARRAVDLVNPYLVPDLGLRRALVRAIGRGVRVRLVVPARGDLRVVQWAVEATVDALVRRGAHAFAYQPATLHAKTALVDGELTTIGTYNLDERSHLYNLEVNLAVRSRAFGAIVRAEVERDIRDATVPWTIEALRARGLFRRVLGWVALLFAQFL
jgi:cardiolipin synthase